MLSNVRACSNQKTKKHRDDIAKSNAEEAQSSKKQQGLRSHFADIQL